MLKKNKLYSVPGLNGNWKLLSYSVINSQIQYVIEQDKSRICISRNVFNLKQPTNQHLIGK